MITSEEALSDAIRAAQGPLSIRGGGTRGVAVQGAPLDLFGLTGITLYEPETLTLIARAGTPLAEIDSRLAAQDQRLAFEPPDWRGLLGTEGPPTIGGVIAGNLSGPRRLQAGAARDAALGVRFVDGTGMVVRNGGRVMKNVTGYDLVKLFCGSWGTLGALSEVSLKLAPRPEAEATLILKNCAPDQAVALMTQAMRSPYDPSGAARLPDGRVLVRLEGFAGSVAYRSERLADQLGADEVRPAPELWQAVRDVAPFHGRAGDVWRFSVKPSDAPMIVQRLGGEVVLDWAGGLIWALLPQGSDARALAAPYQGHATLIRADADTRARIPRLEPQAAPVAALTRAIRQKFDPRGILNPGVMA